MGYKFELGLLHRHFQNYNVKAFNLGIKMKYKCTVTIIGKKVWNKLICKRELIKIWIPNQVIW